MSKELKRYDPFGYDGLSALMREDEYGDYVRHDDYEALLAERDALRAFGNEIVSAAFEGGSFDGGDIQDMATKHRLLRVEQRDDECGEHCACREYGFPAECYRKTELLGFAALQGEQP